MTNIYKYTNRVNGKVYVGKTDLVLGFGIMIIYVGLGWVEGRLGILRYESTESNLLIMKFSLKLIPSLATWSK